MTHNRTAARPVSASIGANAVTPEVIRHSPVLQDYNSLCVGPTGVNSAVSTALRRHGRGATPGVLNENNLREVDNSMRTISVIIAIMILVGCHSEVEPTTGSSGGPTPTPAQSVAGAATPAGTDVTSSRTDSAPGSEYEPTATVLPLPEPTPMYEYVPEEPDLTWLGPEALFWATAGVAEIRDAIDMEGQHPEDRLDDGWITGLHAVAAFGDLDVLQFLLDWGADIMLPASGGATPLHLAAANNTPEMVGFLIDRGAEVRNVDENGDTPLGNAAGFNPDPKVTEMLLDQGARLDHIGGSGATAIHLAAAFNENPDVALLLLERGADILGVDYDGSTLLHNAAYGGNLRLAQRLVDEGFDVNAESESGTIPLHHAAQEGNPEIVDWLQQQGSEIDAKESIFGFTPLHSAVAFSASGYMKGTIVEVIGLLLGAGHLVDARDDQGRTALHWVVDPEGLHDYSENDDWFAARWGEPTSTLEVMESLLDQGADPSAKDHGHFTPLHHAVDSGEPDRVSLLLQYGADIYAENEFGETACSRATGWEAFEGTEVLGELCGGFASWLNSDFWTEADREMVLAELEAGADPRAQNSTGETVLHMATQLAGDPSVVEVLLNQGADTEVPIAYAGGEYPLHVAATRRDPAFAKVLLTHGANIDTTDHQGQTPLYTAALYSGWEGTKVLELLLDQGANIESENQYGQTPLFAAIEAVSRDAPERRGPTAVSILVERGARVDVVDKGGGTLLHHAASFRGVKPELVEFLIEQGIPVDVEDAYGDTALDLASSRTSDRVIRLLGGTVAEPKSDKSSK